MASLKLFLFVFYWSGVTCGLIFPLLDQLCYRHWREYRSWVGPYPHDQFHEMPWHVKVILALLPFFNLLFDFVVFVTFYMMIKRSVQRFKRFIVRSLAKNNKHMHFKAWFISRIMPYYMQYYLDCIEDRIMNSLEADRTIMRLIEVMEKIADEIENRDKQESKERD